LGGFVQELADAITDYRVRVAGLTVALTERPARFRCNKECTRGRGKFMTIPKMSTARPGKSGTIPRTSIVTPRTFVTTPENIRDDTKNIRGDTENLRDDTKNLLGDTENLLVRQFTAYV
jgi:hypothetical protein